MAETKNILFVGPQNSGKTTLSNQILRNLHLPYKTYADITPTKGFSTHHLPHHSIHLWDVSGQKQFMQSWPNYIKRADVVFIVVDGTHKTQEMLNWLYFVDKIVD